MENDRLLVTIKTGIETQWTIPSNWDWVSTKIENLPDEGLLVMETEFRRQVHTADAFVKYGGAQ